MKSVFTFLATILTALILNAQCVTTHTQVLGYDTLQGVSNAWTNCLPVCENGNRALIDLLDNQQFLVLESPDTTLAQVRLIRDCHEVLFDTCMTLDGIAAAGLGTYLSLRVNNVNADHQLFVSWQMNKHVVIWTKHSSNNTLYPVLYDMHSICGLSTSTVVPTAKVNLPYIDIITGQQVDQPVPNRVYLHGSKKVIVAQ